MRLQLTRTKQTFRSWRWRWLIVISHIPLLGTPSSRLWVETQVDCSQSKQELTNRKESFLLPRYKNTWQSRRRFSSVKSFYLFVFSTIALLLSSDTPGPWLWEEWQTHSLGCCREWGSFCNSATYCNSHSGGERAGCERTANLQPWREAGDSTRGSGC